MGLFIISACNKHQQEFYILFDNTAYLPQKTVVTIKGFPVGQVTQTLPWHDGKQLVVIGLKQAMNIPIDSNIKWHNSLNGNPSIHITPGREAMTMETQDTFFGIFSTPDFVDSIANRFEQWYMEYTCD